MTSPKTIFPVRKKSIFGSIVFFAFLLTISLAALRYQHTPLSSGLFVFFWIVILFNSTLLIVWILRMFRWRTGIVLDEEGIRDASGFTDFAFISWKDISALDILDRNLTSEFESMTGVRGKKGRKSANYRILKIAVEDPTRIKRPLLSRLARRTLAKNYAKLAFIQDGLFDVELETLEKAMRNRLRDGTRE